jgi:hypothetical protein
MYLEPFDWGPLWVKGDVFRLEEFGFACAAFWNKVGSGPDTEARPPKDTRIELTVDNDLLLEKGIGLGLLKKLRIQAYFS